MSHENVYSDSENEPPGPETPLYSSPRFPTSYETPDDKRKVSDTSFGTRSTETTPHKLIQPETGVQSLQNAFVTDIINHL